jgi:hypothetical protein
MSKPVIKEDDVHQTIELDELFGVDFSGDRALREVIGEAILEKIRTRTADGKAIGGNKDLKKPYSESYKKSDLFRGFGKSEDVINMSLTGDMLGLMDIVDQDDNSITIGWDDSEQTAKAYNHNVGDTVPKRPFFGLTSAELKELARELKPDIREARKVREEEGADAYEDKLLSLIDELSEDDDD